MTIGTIQTARQAASTKPKTAPITSIRSNSSARQSAATSTSTFDPNHARGGKQGAVGFHGTAPATKPVAKSFFDGDFVKQIAAGIVVAAILAVVLKSKG